MFQATWCLKEMDLLCSVCILCADVNVMCVSGYRVPTRDGSAVVLYACCVLIVDVMCFRRHSAYRVLIRDGSAMSCVHFFVLMWMWCAFQATECLKEMDLLCPLCICVC